MAERLPLSVGVVSSVVPPLPTVLGVPALSAIVVMVAVTVGATVSTLKEKPAEVPVLPLASV